MRTNKRYSRNGVGLTLILFLFFFSPVLFSTNVLLEDSTKKFELNDPRNPDCPCHKYQKLADEEYQRSLGKLIQKHSQKTAEFEGKSFSNETKATKKHYKAYIKHKCKKRSKFFNKLRLIFGINHWDIWKRITDPSACYHWH